MNECRDDGWWCHFHPKETIVGVCALCLNERLLVLASKQSHLKPTNTSYCATPKRVLPKIFDFTNLLSRLDIKHQKSEVYHSSSTSPEDSFISIKFENNGAASWDRGKASKMRHDQQCKGKVIQSLIEHAKPHATLRWRKRIGHLLQLIRWKRSSRDMCQVGTNKYGWIKTLIKKGKDQ